MFDYMRPVLALCAAVPVFLMAADSARAAETSRAGASWSGPDRTSDSGGFVIAQAYDPLVCCYKRQAGGALLFFLAPKSQCRPSGGREVGMARCRRPGNAQVCCSTPNGFLSMGRRQCRRAGREADPARCGRFRGRREFRGRRVCCATPNGFRTMSREACIVARGRAALAVRCSPRALVCCKAAGPDGKIRYRLLTARTCKNARGRVAKGRFCRGALRRHTRGR